MPVKFSTGLPSAGQLQLQVCGNCQQVNYPQRELCGSCLANALQWQAVADGGVVQSSTELHYSLEQEYAAHLPWPVASVLADCGPVIFAHLQPGLEPGARVKLRIACDTADNRMLVALAENELLATQGSDWLANIEFKESSE